MDSLSVPDVVFVDDIENLPDIRDLSQKVGKIGVDLESNSMYRYNHEISLMQIAVDKTVYLLDIPKIGFPDDLKKILSDPKIVKVFQDMQYDMALFNYQFNFQPSNLFDISVADKLVRLSHQYRSLDKMVDNYLGESIETSKSVQRSNWAKRPLSEKQLRYAAKDTRYLVPIMDKLKSIISDDYRLPCLKLYLERQEPTDLNRKYNIHSMWKIKNIYSLDQFQLNLLKNLLLKRNEIAIRENRPIHWIARERLLLQVVRKFELPHVEFRKILTKDQPKHLRDTIINELYETYQCNIDELEYLEKPPHGTSLRKWVSVDKDESLPFANPEVLNDIRDWTKLIADNTKLLPEMILSKDNQIKTSLAIQNRYNYDIEFDGLITPFSEIFLKDLKQYLKTNTSQLSFDYLNSLYKSN